jgi:Flp pilus assembly protein TadD
MKPHFTITSCLLLLSLPVLTLLTPTPSFPKSTTPRSCQLQSENKEGYSPEQLKTIAERITVRVRGNNTAASGTLVAKQGHSYFLVLTNHHVTRRIAPGNIKIQTVDGKIHQGRVLDKFNLLNQQEFAKYDLAILEFTASENYCLPTRVFNNQIPDQIEVLASGYSVQTGRITFAEGQIKKIVTEPALARGYEIGYDSRVEQGMSGGPIISSKGELLGINGKSAFPILNGGYIYADGTKPTSTQIQELRKLSWGIPITSILAQMKPEFLTAYELPVPNIAPKVPVQTLTLPQWIGKIEEKAKQFTVRIDDSKVENGSGVIIDKQENTTASNWLEWGNQLWRLGRYPEAITAFDNAIKEKPEFIHLAYYGKGLALSRSGKVMEAVIALEEAVKAKSDSVPAWTILSLLNTKLGRFDQALLAVNQAIKLQPDNPNLYNEKLVVLSNLKRYQEAIDAIDQAIKLSPHADFYYNRGAVRSRLGDNQGAITDLQKAADLLQKQGLSAE